MTQKKIIDVRNQDEFQTGYIPGSVCIPLDEIQNRCLEIPTEDEVILVCRSGKRSQQALTTLQNLGYKNITSMQGGINDYRKSGGRVIQKTKIIPIMRQVQIVAGLLVLIGVVLGFFFHPHWFFLSGFVGAGLCFAGLSGTCLMGDLLMKMPWNQISKASHD